MTTSHLPTHKHSASETSCAVSKYIAERWEKLSRTERQPVSSGPIVFTKGHLSVDAARPTWARQHRIRRGVDIPFSKPPPKRGGPPVFLAPPPRIHPRQVVTSWDSYSLEISEQPETTKTVFDAGFRRSPTQTLLSNLSEWVRADSASEITAHTESIASR